MQIANWSVPCCVTWRSPAGTDFANPFLARHDF